MALETDHPKGVYLSEPAAAQSRVFSTFRGEIG